MVGRRGGGSETETDRDRQRQREWGEKAVRDTDGGAKGGGSETETDRKTDRERHTDRKVCFLLLLLVFYINNLYIIATWRVFFSLFFF